MHYFDGRCWDGWQVGWMTIAWLLPVVVVGLVIWAMKRGVRPGEPADPPETILKRRYAKGEIDRDTYQRMLDDLTNR